MSGGGPRHGYGIPIGGVIILLAGVILLLNNVGVLPWSVWGAIWRLWPILIIMVGINILLGRGSPWLVAVIVLAVLVAALVFIFWHEGWRLAPWPNVRELFFLPAFS